jgi:hypothetical protein
MKGIAAAHYEAAGQVTGTVRLGDEVYGVEGLGYRDHSWGPRDWGRVRSHRWVVGTFGPDFSFSILTIHGTEGEFTGYVVRDGVPTRAAAVDVVAYIEPDGFTHRGGRATIKMGTGEDIGLDMTVVDGIGVRTEAWEGVEGICRARWGNREGFSDFEMSNNARSGGAPIALALRAAIGDGLEQNHPHRKNGGD